MNRIYYAIQQVGIKSCINSSQNFVAISGIQSVGMNTSFNNSQTYSFGEVEIFHNAEDNTEVSISLKKILDGNSLLYSFATQDSETPLLLDKINQQCILGLSIFDDTSTSAINTPIDIMQSSGLYLTSAKYNFSTEGNFEEDITLVGTNKLWKKDTRVVNPDNVLTQNSMDFRGQFTGNDSPRINVQRRADLILNGEYPDTTTLPIGIYGIDEDGNPIEDQIHITNISVSLNINRENIQQFGNRQPFFKLSTLPIEIITEITINAINSENMSFTEEGILKTDTTPCSMGNNNTDELILIATCDGTRIFLGSKNRLQAVSYNGGDVSGSPVKITYTYKTFNEAIIIHENDTAGDPAGLWWEDRFDLFN